MTRSLPSATRIEHISAGGCPAILHSCHPGRRSRPAVLLGDSLLFFVRKGRGGAAKQHPSYPVAGPTWHLKVVAIVADVCWMQFDQSAVDALLVPVCADGLPNQLLDTISASGTFATLWILDFVHTKEQECPQEIPLRSISIPNPSTGEGGKCVATGTKK